MTLMTGTMKRVGVELVWFIGACAVGAFIWVAIAGGYEGASDAYWTANGHPPPAGMFRAPWEWRFVITLVPYGVIMALRLGFGRALVRLLKTPVGKQFGET
jgi:hypothetical protein